MKNGKDKTPFYEKPNAYKKSGIIALIGCAFMLASTFIYWINIYVKTGETDYGGTSIFMTIFKSLRGHISFGVILSAFLLLVLYAVFTLLAILGIYDNFKKKPLLTKWKKRTRFSLIVISVLLVVVITHLPVFKGSVENLEELVASWSAFIDMSKQNHVPGAGTMKCMMFVGPGFFCYIIGVIMYLFSVIYSFVLDTLNED